MLVHTTGNRTDPKQGITSIRPTTPTISDEDAKHAATISSQ